MTSSIYLKTNKDYNNFQVQENIKSWEVTGGVIESAPSAPPDSFFQLGQKHTILNFRGGILSGGAYAPPVLKQGGHMHTVPHGCARLWPESIKTSLYGPFLKIYV